MMSTRVLTFTLLVAATLACGDESVSPSPVPKPPNRIEILPAAVAITPLKLSDTIRLHARRIDEAGVPLTNDDSRFLWESMDTTVLFVDAAGLARIVGLGSGMIRVRIADTLSPTSPSTTDTASATVSLTGSPTVFHPGPVIAAATFSLHQCVLLSGGEAECRGRNNSGETGTGSVTAAADSLTAWTRVVGGISFSTISNSLQGTCALGPEGRAYCWGTNGRGQFGYGVSVPANSATPVEVGGGHRWLSIQTRGHSQTCGITTTNVPLCVGHNDWGQVGREPKVPADTILAEYGSGHLMSMIVTDDFMTCGLRTDGQVYCSGYGGPPSNSVETPPHGAPTRIGGTVVFTAIGVGRWHGCGLDAAGTAYCWGYNEEGQLGTGDFEMSGTARPVAGGLTFARIYVWDWTSCGVTMAGETWCWGSNQGHALGRTRLTKSPIPIRVAIGLDATSIDRLSLYTVTFATCAIDKSARLICWGDGY
jgi:hypothetical protein